MRSRSSILPDRLAAIGLPGQAFDVAAAMMGLALRITARTLFDTEVTPEIHVINDQVNIVMDLYNYLVTMPRAELLLDSPLPGMRRFRSAKARLDEVVDGMIRARRAEAAAFPGGLKSGAICSRCCLQPAREIRRKVTAMH